MLKIQWQCLFVEITNPGIPWTGMQCRSKRAGGTGILYALPFFVSPSPDCYLWIVQGTCINFSLPPLAYSDESRMILPF
jgi:hypothetical protein